MGLIYLGKLNYYNGIDIEFRRPPFLWGFPFVTICNGLVLLVPFVYENVNIPFMYVYTDVELDVVICDFKVNVLYNALIRMYLCIISDIIGYFPT